MPTNDVIKTALNEQEAATFLSVSEPFMALQLDTGKIRYLTVGASRFVELPELAIFKNSMQVDTSAALQELATQAQELRLGY